MSRTIRFFLFLTLSIICFVAAGWLTVDQLNRYNALLERFPAQATIAGVPVDHLDRQAAQDRLSQLYVKTPVEVKIVGEDGQSSPVQLDPASLGQQVDIEGMLNGTAMILSQRAYWPAFWDYLFNHTPEGFQAPLACTVDEAKLRAGLKEQVEGRYTNPPTAAHPILGDVRFTPGQGGQTLDIDGAIESIKAALCSATQRTATIKTVTSGPRPPDPEQLAPTLETLAQVSGYPGLIELYYQDLRTGQEINFALNQGKEIKPGVSFTAASTIKIPVIVSAYKRIDGEPSDEVKKRMGLMIDLSDNASTDEVMKLVLDPNIAPVQVTEDMQALGLKDTFLAGMFYDGAPLLNRYQTTANSRSDITTEPDIYNQTTAADMGRLLAGIEHCAADNTGALVTTFQGKITQAECQSMIDLLLKNRKGLLIEAGVPEGTKLAHKYGWILDVRDGLMKTASDAAIVYTPHGNFILTIYLYDPAQLNWDDAQKMVARIVTGLMNYYQLKP